MPKVGRGHFDTYTEQNRVKHAILTKYLRAYLIALKSTADAFHYIDGFAGSGEYADEHPGSPCVALELLAEHARAATASFVESDPALFGRLEGTMAKSPAASALCEPPLLRCGLFADRLSEVLARSIYGRFRRVATFAFVDPCGVDGLRVADLFKILELSFAEALVFWNYDGLNRWLGGVAAGTHERRKLDDFYGSSDAAAEALVCVATAAGAARERCLLEGYLRTLRRGSGAEFVLPFRFRAADKNRTSHYLIHLARHPRAFVIMKDVMQREASTGGDLGSFEFITAEELGSQGHLFHPNADHARDEVLQALEHATTAVSVFRTKWPERPNDMLTSQDYKAILLQLEAEGSIEVLDGKTHAPKPAAKRVREGKVTLGERCLVRLRGRR